MNPVLSPFSLWRPVWPDSIPPGPIPEFPTILPHKFRGVPGASCGRHGDKITFGHVAAIFEAAKHIILQVLSSDSSFVIL